ncbi:ATP-grasp domain-containing protein [Actimicrobium sp. CCI2.3]|uniref:ATP-grasp domain-containing protein n=1 Tax=Actimicrobium sp. CCI2.3 TaxID=3048616 RepID=UPI002AB5859F|nr:ATP-grasp domain-containing protein [Actimicrobium sp. CCI2.3]MDY7575158.1 ATP-grasp domain-containing protein [Actimicrobium sp. CCI2.3]MEB0023589.1 ATP-grasp domain-containing protein [Actimicrobium sp. CCI2.3]
MKIFICEHDCHPVAADADLSSSSDFRGDMLLSALLADLSRIDDLSVTVMRLAGHGLRELPDKVSVVMADGDDHTGALLRCIDNADAVWPLAPESRGLLESISRTTLQKGKLLIGSSPDAVRLAGSKYLTSQALRAAGMAVVPTYFFTDILPPGSHAWIVKPDDGAGCSDTHLLSSAALASEWINARPARNVILQPYVAGRPCSLSLLCGSNEVFLLGCSEQRIAAADHRIHYLGSTVNSISDTDGRLERLARDVVAAIPGLWGYVGIDIMITQHGPVVLGVNPRMTMCHAGLHDSIGVNPAGMLVEMLRSGRCSAQRQKKNRQVSIDVHGGLPHH